MSFQRGQRLAAEVTASLPDSGRGDPAQQMLPREESALLLAKHRPGPWDQGRQEEDPEKWHLRFRAFCWEGSDPVRELRRLSELCHHWLRPDLHSKEQILEQLVMEQLVISAPEELQVLIREGGVRSCRDLEELLQGRGRPLHSYIVIYQGQKFLMRDVDMELGKWTSTINLTTTCQHSRDAARPPRSPLTPQPRELAGAGGPAGTQRKATLPETTSKEGDQVQGEDGEQASASAQEPPELLLPPAAGAVVTQDNREPREEDTSAQDGEAGEEEEGKEEGEEEAIDPAAAQVPVPGGCSEAAPGGDSPSARSPAQALSLSLSPAGPQGGAGLDAAVEGGWEAHGPAAHKCRECGRAFQYRSQLVIHQRSHTGERPFHCDKCHKGFMQLSDLRVHQRIHTGERPFRCHLCTKAFTHESTLLGHVRVHTREQPYACEHCGKSFSHRGNLNVHTRIHTQAKPYPCPVCGLAFRQLGTMKRHHRVHAKAGRQEGPVPAPRRA